MQFIYLIFTVSVFYSLFMFDVTHENLTDFFEELYDSKEEIIKLIKKLFNQSNNTAEETNIWRNIQLSTGLNRFTDRTDSPSSQHNSSKDKVPVYRGLRRGGGGGGDDDGGGGGGGGGDDDGGGGGGGGGDDDGGGGGGGGDDDGGGGGGGDDDGGGVFPYPRRFDWRDGGAVGPVHNQKSCGGCWAFSVVSAVESVRVKDGGRFLELSVQQLIDCAYQSRGCDGGSTLQTLEWLKRSGEKLVNGTEYPYKEESGVCRVFPLSHGGVVVKDYAAFNFSGQEEEMSRRLVDWGPLVVIVNAVSWQDYQRGIIQHHCSAGHANHAVVITGYDTTGDVPYWIVRNSWGTSWGNEGYAYIKMGENICGVADSVAAVFL